MTTVTQLNSGADLATATEPNVNVNSYQAGANDGGGGTFVRFSSPFCGADNGVMFNGPTGTGYCYRRQFAGPVHLKWYGVVSSADSGAPDVSAQLTAALAVAAAANPGNDASASRVVDTDAMRIHANSSISIPADVRLTCDATPGTQRTSSGSQPDYTTTPASIVLTDPTVSITIPDDGGVPGDNAEFDHCIVLTMATST